MERRKSPCCTPHDGISGERVFVLYDLLYQIRLTETSSKILIFPASMINNRSAVSVQHHHIRISRSLFSLLLTLLKILNHFVISYVPVCSTCPLSTNIFMQIMYGIVHCMFPALGTYSTVHLCEQCSCAI